jgi:hypothetical protein
MVLGSNLCRDKIFFFFFKCPDQLWGSASFLYEGTGGSFPGLKQLGCEVNHLCPSVGNILIYDCFDSYDKGSLRAETYCF